MLTGYIGGSVLSRLLEHPSASTFDITVLVRSEEKANAAIADLKKVTGKDDIHFLPLDLSSFSSIKKSAEQFKRCSA